MFGIVTPPLKPTLARLLAGLAASVGLGGSLVAGAKLIAPPAPFEDNVLTHDPARYARNVQQILEHPDLALGPPTWGWLAFAFAATAELQRGDGAPKVATPVTVLAAGEDRLVDNAQLRLVTERFAHHAFEVIPGAYHEILQETDDIRAVFWRRFDAAVAELA
jgi:lysophospholipase